MASEVPAEQVTLESITNSAHVIALGGLSGIASRTNSNLTSGLQSEEVVKQNKATFGENKLPSVPSKSFFEHLTETFEDVTLRILLAAALFEIVYALTLSDSKYLDMVQGAAIMVAAVIVSGVNSYQNYSQDREFKALAKLQDDFPIQVIRGGKIATISSLDIVVGDIICVTPGLKFPCDGILIEGHQVMVSQAVMNGESAPVHKEASEDCILLSSTVVTQGEGRMIATAVGAKSSAGQLVSSMQEQEVEPTPLQQKLEELAEQIGKVGLFAGVITFAALSGLWLYKSIAIEGTPLPALLAFTSLATLFRFFIVGVAIVIVAVPEGLPLAVTVSLAYSMRRMMADNNYVRKLQACETMGSATVIASDKTGTLTENRMTVVSAYVCGHSFDEGQLASMPTVVGNKGVIATLCDAIALNTTAAIAAGDAPAAGTAADGKAASASSGSSGSGATSSRGAQPEFIGNPTEGAMLVMLNTLLSADSRAVRRHEYAYDDLRADTGKPLARRPFDNRYKYMSTLYAPRPAPASSTGRADTSARLFVKGAPEVLLGMCSGVQAADGSTTPISDSIGYTIEQATKAMAKQGLRTIAVAYRRVPASLAGVASNASEATRNAALTRLLNHSSPIMPATNGAGNGVASPDALSTPYPPPTPDASGENVLERDLVLLGLFGIQDPLRGGVTEALNTCRKAGIRVLMVTGDHRDTAEAISQQCGIYTPGKGLVMEGSEFRALTDDQRDDVTRRLSVLARSSPNDKQLLVESLKRNGEIVAVTGDGTNDAPALTAAHVGLAMGAGTEIAKEASDIVIRDNSFSSIVASVRWGRSIKENIRKFLTFQLTINIVALTLTFITACANGGDTDTNFPITAVQLLWVNLIMDSFAALALATEPPSDRLLAYPPQGITERLITATMVKNMVGHALFQIAVLLVLTLVPGMREWVYDWKAGTPYPNTPVFTTFVLLQVFNLFNCRSVHDEWNIVQDFSSSIVGQVIVAIIVVFQVLLVTFGRDFMQTHPMTAHQWGLCVALGALSVPVGYILKLVPAGEGSPTAPSNPSAIAPEAATSSTGAGAAQNAPGSPIRTGGGASTGGGSSSAHKGGPVRRQVSMDALVAKGTTSDPKPIAASGGKPAEAASGAPTSGGKRGAGNRHKGE